MFDLSGKTALITGATGGIGEAVARALHQQGATVILTGTRAEKLQEIQATLGARAFCVACNLSQAEDVEKLVGEAEQAAGAGLDILVNNAGITRDNITMRLKDDDWQSVLDVNLTAAFRLSRAAMRGMMKRRFGRMINMTSVVAVTGNAGQANYAAAKAGMIGMTKALAQELASRNITVNCIAPGFIETAMTSDLTEAQKSAILGNVPVGRLGTSEEIAAAAVYLASPQAAYTTGQTLHVNGGMAMI